MTDLIKKYPHLEKEWHLEKNKGISFGTLKVSGSKKYWWLGECGHEWQSTVINRLQRKGCPYCCNQRILLGFNDLASQCPTLAKEWHPHKNHPLIPEEVGVGSGKKVWWKGTCEHEWMATIASRHRGAGCPYCQNRKLLTGFNDLATQYPDLAREWHPTLNEGRLPRDVLAKGTYRAWWRCPYHHEWNATVVSRANGTGCPYCSGKRVKKGINDLASTHPTLAEQWHPTKNDHLSPDQVFCRSSKLIWWRCEYGHEWQAKVRDRLKESSHSDCRFCMNREVWTGFNDLKTLHPEIAKEWHPTKNHPLIPERVLAGSTQKVWWKGKCGHEWQATLVNRTAKATQCPYCTNKKVLQGFNDLATTHPHLAKEWHPELNGDLTPEQVVRGTLKKVWWICRNGHVWKTSVAYRTGGVNGKRLGTNCPICTKKSGLKSLF